MEKIKLTNKHKVLWYMMNHYWVILPELRKPDIGGDAADVRLRELRRDCGFDIINRRRKKHGKPTNTYEYHLNTPIEKIDFENLKVIDAAN